MKRKQLKRRFQFLVHDVQELWRLSPEARLIAAITAFLAVVAALMDFN